MTCLMEFDILTKFSSGNIKTSLFSDALKLNTIQLLVRDCLLLLPLIGNGFAANKVCLCFPKGFLYS